MAAIPILPTVADRLAWLLEHRGVSASSLSQAAGLSRAVVGQIIHGRFQPKGKTVLALANAAGVHAAWLMWGTGPRETAKMAR